jgi:hypothetical protein
VSIVRMNDRGAAEFTQNCGEDARIQPGMPSGGVYLDAGSSQPISELTPFGGDNDLIDFEGLQLSR